MAMTLVEQFDSWTPPLKILATDLDTGVLAKAEAGVYADERVEKLSPERVRRFFLRGSGANAGSVRVREELRKLVTFRKLKLMRLINGPSLKQAAIDMPAKVAAAKIDIKA